MCTRGKLCTFTTDEVIFDTLILLIHRLTKADAAATTINTQVTLRVHECEDIIYQEAQKNKKTMVHVTNIKPYCDHS